MADATQGKVSRQAVEFIQGVRPASARNRIGGGYQAGLIIAFLACSHD